MGKSLSKGVSDHFRSKLFAGLLLLLPVVVSFVVLRFLFNIIDGFVQPIIENVTGRRIPWLGLVVLVFVVYLAGVLGANFVGKRLVRWSQGLLLKVPIVRMIYAPAKQLVDSFSGNGATGFKRVVVVEEVRTGLWTLGFLTGLTKDEKGNPMAIVYIPTAPTPQSGWVTIAPVGIVYDTDLTVPAAMNLVMSGGINAPAQIRRTPLKL